MCTDVYSSTYYQFGVYARTILPAINNRTIADYPLAKRYYHASCPRRFFRSYHLFLTPLELYPPFWGEKMLGSEDNVRS